MSDANNKPLRYLLQAFNYTVFMALIYFFFLTAPSIRLLVDDEEARAYNGFFTCG